MIGNNVITRRFSLKEAQLRASLFYSPSSLEEWIEDLLRLYQRCFENVTERRAALKINRTSDAEPIVLQNVRVNHRCRNLFVS